MVINAMDGRQSVDELWQDAVSRLGNDAPSQDEFIQLLAQLHAADLLQTEVTPEFGGIAKALGALGAVMVVTEHL